MRLPDVGLNESCFVVIERWDLFWILILGVVGGAVLGGCLTLAFQ